ncbi:OmpA family protein [Akkermansiaceae bacterium]|nr:OmpA family protein [Akkermansiaceae bacterium]
MEDQQDPTPATSPATEATPASNQNLILGIVMGAVVLLLLLLVITQQFGDQGDKTKDPKIVEMQKELAEMKAENTFMATTLPNNQTANLLVEEIKRDVATLGAIVEKGQNNLVALKDSQATVQSLSRQLAELQRQNDLNNDAAARVAGLEAQLKSLEGAVDQETMNALRDQLIASKAKQDQLTKALSDLESKSTGMVDANRFIAVQEERDEVIKENSLLRREVQELRTKLDGAKLFVSRENLHPKAQALFRELERLEGSDRTALETAYLGINKTFNAQVVVTTTFKTGSAELSKKIEDHLAELTKLADPNNFYLIVGYASKTGDVKSNRALSEQRATRVAATANHYKLQNQQVQAVYLGETNRFSPDPLPNQICEIWSIRP